ncbi:MAG: hypothetical protein U1E02_38480, partial [Hydrogenophaga sp.]|nr:hypothetical protein [Hydrogenophaga sp.]
MKPAKVLRTLRSACRLEGFEIELSLLKPDQYAMSYFGHAEFGGAEVWISWIESSVPGRGFEAMRRLCQAADDHDVVLRLSPEDHGSGKLIALYERLGFERDPAGGENMERVPQLSRERALRQWLDKSVVTASSVPGDAPRVVYRGTAPLNVVTRGSFGAGLYFAGDEAQAAQYAGNRGEVLPYHLNLKNPYLFSIREPQVVDSWGEGLVRDIFEPGSADRLIEQALHDPQGGFGPEIEERLRELGHDGVVATYSDGTQEFVAFRQTQVRPASEHVLPEREVARSEALAHWFEGSQVVGGDGAPLVLYHGTTADATKFDPSYAGSDGIRYALPAIFATTDARLASDYALNKFSREIADAMRALQQYKNLHPGEYGPEYEERYEAVKAAFRAADHGVQHGEGANVMPVYMALKNPLRID